MTSSQSIYNQGSGNIHVQASGTNIRVDVSVPHLVLTSLQKRLQVGPVRPDHDVDLLHPFRRTIPLVGRENDMDDLWEWLHSEARVSIRVIVGRAGAGKTRLALELMDRLTGSADWQAGFV